MTDPERNPTPEYLIALTTYIGVRWDKVLFNFWWTTGFVDCFHGGGFWIRQFVKDDSGNWRFRMFHDLGGSKILPFLKRCSGRFGMFIDFIVTLFFDSIKLILPPIIMEVEHELIVKVTSLGGSHFQLDWLWEEDGERVYKFTQIFPGRNNGWDMVRCSWLGWVCALKVEVETQYTYVKGSHCRSWNAKRKLWMIRVINH